MTLSSPPIRIALVDDQALIRTGLRMVLENEPDIDVVNEAEDGHGAIELARVHRLDVILMDVRMPRLDGIAATTAILRQETAPKVIMLTTFDLDEYAFAAIRAGASGFLLKDARPADLTAAIRAVHTGDAALSPRVTRRMVELFAKKLPVASADNPGTTETSSILSTLTPREQDILVAVAEGLNNSEITERFCLSESTVKTHISHLLQKLNARDRVHLVILAYQNGMNIGTAAHDDRP
ncbi:MAG: DNA-binding response regulator [Candidatus Lumbricidophila eiseniae]|uniref:DNA-binding response regulator n=1 Tax=Candidatus Lumbricidiphila eiseniae TaxID=1969409 RepID=A0A2A6FRD4_9MICO|nr:MAG: DNA-binding response regulator [Candidatus Lumbricidophila eiseniae]